MLLTHCYSRPRVIDDAVAERAREMLSGLLLLHVLSSAMFYLVSAKDTHSDTSYVQAWPFYLLWLYLPCLYLLWRATCRRGPSTPPALSTCSTHPNPNLQPHSKPEPNQAWPFYASGLVYVFYAAFPFQWLMKRRPGKEDSGTGGRKWSEGRMVKYRCVHQCDAQLHSRVTDKAWQGRPLTGAGKEHELPPYIQGFVAELCPCSCDCATNLLEKIKSLGAKLQAKLKRPTKQTKTRLPTLPTLL